MAKKYKPRDYQEAAAKAAVDFLLDDSENGNGLLVLATGCHAKGYEILMSDGTLKRVEDIEVGDKVMGDDGTPRTVLKLHRGEDDMFRITPKKGESFVVNGGHLLHLYKTRRHKNDKTEYVTISVKDYIYESSTFKHLHKLYRSEGVGFGNEYGYMVEPYFLGLFIGDGCSVSGINITTMRKEVEAFIYEFAERYGLKIRKSRRGESKAYTYYFTYKAGVTNPLKRFLMDRELYESRSGNKVIPYDYMVAKRADRLELLAGLLDTDAYYNKEGHMYEYSTKCKRLAYQIQSLCRSLGLYALIGKAKIINGVSYYRLQITGDISVIPTRVGIRSGEDRRQIKNHRVCCFDVEYVGKGEYYGFTLDGNHLYLDWQYFVHHNSGKSLVISEIADKLNDNVLVFCPSKEILQQNYAKMKTYTDDCAMYSASVGKKKIAKVTFATIGSVKNNKPLFDEFKYILVDEAHTAANTEKGMYKDFFEYQERKVVGLTATPYRLLTKGQKWDYKAKKMDLSEAESYLIPIVGEKQVFQKVLYNIDTEELLEKGYLARLKYFDVRTKEIKDFCAQMFPNTSGSDFSERSLQWMEEHTGFYNYTVYMINRIMHPKDGKQRNGILCFVRLVEVAEFMATQIPSSRAISAKTPKKEREEILKDFAEGKFQVLLNASLLTTGYDRPDLDTVLITCPTMSLSRWYQSVGRALRPYEGKDAWIIDIGGNLERFGEVHRLKFKQDANGEWNVYNDKRRLTNVKL